MTEMVSAITRAEDASSSRGYASFQRRVSALIVDSFVVAGLFLSSIILIMVLDKLSASAVGVAVMIAGIFLYEPILVAARGGTIGHYRTNLRVVDQESGDRIGLLRAIARCWIKAFTGIFSVFFMMVTRRHQALHDLATGSAVIIHDMSAARPQDYLMERAPSEVIVAVPGWKRVLAILGYTLGSFVAFSLLSAFTVSAPCLNQNICTPGENLYSTVMGLLMFLSFGVLLVLGWKGKLPGARPGRSSAAAGTF